ncbi:MAG: Alpha/beta hydrolase fold-3 domain protein [Herbinix sp.]|jgi:acetyl esterase/lipase|nr:Alpha/beta hydrolase fold-3 domain protein [Herbinix sp.]
MKEYDDLAIQRLNTEKQVIKLGDLEVEVKPLPDGTTDRLDAKELKEIIENTGWKEEPTLEQIRDSMGCFNYNLNSVEIYTGYQLIETSYGLVPVWSYFPRKTRRDKNRKAYLYLHGGGFFGGSVFAVENQCRLIAERANCVVFNIDYALAPDQPYPAAGTQIYEILKYVHEHAQELGVNKDKIAIGGDSAGGNLSAVCAQMDRDLGTNYLKLQTLIYPKLAFTNYKLPGYTRNEEAFTIIDEQKQYLPGLIYLGCDQENAASEKIYIQGKEDVTHPYISPAFGEKTGLCKTLLLLAEYDGLRLEGEFYAELLQKAGVPVRIVQYNGMRHAYYDKIGILPQTEDTINEIAEDIKKM